ncbi:putative dehydrogenase [Haloactinopolyspora alba]|uniref:Putative dehydrogenase n=1 Tax=Haloactinopolyspora alba TaxID=648780 RepID=A0A2P8E720_9ACTN|nr:Gfo/Idh/MocA family oxidoreductase [Haloactinopolyspora alba]PSL05269.1 putative dehydrogenase [Haloactinopolyspora alba]
MAEPVLRVAQLSFWFIHADEMCRRALAAPGVELAAVWDSDTARGERKAAQFGVDFEPVLARLLDRDDIDAVSMCAEPGRHPELVEAAAAAGKHVLIEKPIAGDVEGARRIVDAARTYGVQIMPAYNLRHHPLAARVKQLVDDGAVGDLVRVRKLHGHYLEYEAADYRADRIVTSWNDPVYERRDSLFFAGTHVSLWFEWMFGLPDSALCVRQTVVPGLPVEDNSTVLFRYPRFTGVSELSESLPAQQVATEIYGTDGAIVQLRGNLPSTRVFNQARTPLMIFDRRKDSWWVPDLPPHFLRHEDRYHSAGVFFEALRRGDPVPTSPEAGLRSIAMLVAAERAAASGREVHMAEILTAAEVTAA